jgi:hypothetical protein
MCPVQCCAHEPLYFLDRAFGKGSHPWVDRSEFPRQRWFILAGPLSTLGSFEVAWYNFILKVDINTSLPQSRKLSDISGLLRGGKTTHDWGIARAFSRRQDPRKSYDNRSMIPPMAASAFAGSASAFAVRSRLRPQSTAPPVPSLPAAALEVVRKHSADPAAEVRRHVASARAASAH